MAYRSNRVTMRLTGIHETRRHLAKAIEEKKAAILNSLEEHGDKMYERAQERAPEDTGFLKDMLTGAEEESMADRHWATLQALAYYSIYQEFGYDVPRSDGTFTSVPGKLYMSKAFNETAPEFKEDVKRLLKRD